MMRHGKPTAHDLTPPGFPGQDLARYRTLLPLYNNEQDTFSPWVAFVSDVPDKAEQLRTMDLYDLRHAAADAGKNMTGWDSPRGRVSEKFVATLGEAVGEFVSGDATWMLMRWQGYQHDLPGGVPAIFREVPYDLQELDLPEALAGIRELGMPEFLWCSDQSFAWGEQLFADFGVMTIAAEHYIRHFAPRNFECFYVTPDAVLPDTSATKVTGAAQIQTPRMLPVPGGTAAGTVQLDWWVDRVSSNSKESTPDGNPEHPDYRRSRPADPCRGSHGLRA